MHSESVNSAASETSPTAAAGPCAAVTTTYLVDPEGNPALASQCRILARAGHAVSQPASAHYKSRPELWHEVGAMRFSDGAIVSFDGPAEHLQSLKHHEPLYSGLQVTPDARPPTSPLAGALWERGDFDCVDAVYVRIAEMRAEVRAGGDPAEVLEEEGLEPDYVFELI